MKDELKSFLQKDLASVASPFLLKRAFVIIDEASEDRKSLFNAADKVGRMVELFIDMTLAKSVSENLKMRIEGGL